MNKQIQNKFLQLSYTSNGLTLVERATSKVVFSNASIGQCAFGAEVLQVIESDACKVVVDEAAEKMQVSWANELLEIIVDYSLVEGSAELVCATTITNRSDDDYQLGEISPLALSRMMGAQSHLLSDELSVFSLGRMMVDSSQLGSRDPGNLRAMAVELGVEQKHYTTEYVMSARPVSAGGLTDEVALSFDEISKVSCGFVINLADGLSYVRAAYRGSVLLAGETLTLPALFVDGLSKTDDALDAAADRVAAIYNPPIPEGVVPSGWCSWYYYYPNVSEDDILQNLQFIADRRDRFPYEYIQIDDGYQLHWGDWLLPGKKFPHDMAYLSKEIKKLGFKPGIWVAPMVMTEQSNLFRDHPEWAIKNFETGGPLSQQGWSPPEENPWVMLDGTNPEFLEYIRHIFTVMAHEWGYDYFKLDALSHGAYAGLRHDPTKNGDQALRMVLEVIREAIGPDKYILGCTVPFGSAIGIVNGERVSGDVSTAFLTEQNGCSLERYLPQSMHRSFIHGKWWHNDPDCVLVRSKGTPHNESLKDVGLSLEEARFFVTAVGLIQGIQMVGENMMELEEERLQLLDTILPLMPSPARPLDIFSPQPNYLYWDAGEAHVLAVFNWGAEASDYTITWDMLGFDEAATKEVYELWTDSHLGAFCADGVTLTVPSHSTRVLNFRDAVDRPQVIGFNGHISCGMAMLQAEQWDSEAGVLAVQIEANQAAQLRVIAPEGWTAGAFATCSDGSWSCDVDKGTQEVAIPFVRS